MVEVPGNSWAGCKSACRGSNCPPPSLILDDAPQTVALGSQQNSQVFSFDTWSVSSIFQLLVTCLLMLISGFIVLQLVKGGHDNSSPPHQFLHCGTQLHGCWIACEEVGPERLRKRCCLPIWVTAHSSPEVLTSDACLTDMPTLN